MIKIILTILKILVINICISQTVNNEVHFFHKNLSFYLPKGWKIKKDINNKITIKNSTVKIEFKQINISHETLNSFFSNRCFIDSNSNDFKIIKHFDIKNNDIDYILDTTFQTNYNGIELYYYRYYHGFKEYRVKNSEGNQELRFQERNIHFKVLSILKIDNKYYKTECNIFSNVKQNLKEILFIIENIRPIKN